MPNSGAAIFYTMCWTNFIGVDSVCDPVADSGYYLADIGISKKHLDQYIGPEYKSGQEMAHDRVAFAAKSMQGIANSNFSKKFVQKTLINQTVVGKYQDNLISKPAVAGSMKGIQIEFCDNHSYLNLNITKLSLQVDTTGTVGVFVYDLLQDKLVDTVNIEVEAGRINAKTVNLNYKSSKQKMNYFIGYASDFDSFLTHIYKSGCSSCGGTDYRYSSKFVKNRGATLSNAGLKIDSNIVSANDTGGLSLEYGVSCDFTQWLCSMKHSAALPILFLAGKLILDYALEQNQANSSTIIKRKELETRRDRYQKEYEKHAEGLLNTMALPMDSTCFSCNQPVIITHQAP